MTKYLVMGGAGDMGSSVAEDLVSSGVEEVEICDYNKTSAENLANSLSKREKSKVSFSTIDINNRKDLFRVLENTDIVVNTIGPFYKYEKIVIDAAIETEKDYVDICDDYDATLNVVDKYGSSENIHSKILIGMGWTPGITNVCARAGYLSLDKASDINIAWTGSAADSAGLAVISHVFHAVSGDVPMYLSGKIEYVPARQFKRVIEFPEPVGAVSTYFVGHPEPITIPRYLKNLKNVTLRGALLPDWHNHLVNQFADVGLTEDKKINVNNTEISSRDFLASFVHQTMEQFKSGGVETSGFWVEVIGEKDGKHTKITYFGLDHMRNLTGWSASIGAQYISRARQALPGLYAPEGIIDPKYFFSELSKRGVMISKETVQSEFEKG